MRGEGCVLNSPVDASGLFADRLEARSGRSAGLHYRRMFWLY